MDATRTNVLKCVTGSLLATVLAGTAPGARAQGDAPDLMAMRLDQVIGALVDGGSCEVVGTAVDDVLEMLYGGIRALPSKGELIEQTLAVDEAVRKNELRVAEALARVAAQDRCPEEAARALDLKLFVEEVSEVALAVGRVTRECGEGDLLAEPPCDDLQPLLNEKTGFEFALDARNVPITRGFSVKLRSPAVAPWLRAPQEDVRVLPAVGRDECTSVFKEFRGLMLRLTFQRVIVVTDPWVATFGLPRGTRIPIWRLDFVPSQYVKVWNVCNRRNRIAVFETQRVKQDIPLNFFWRFYPKGH